MKAPKRSKTQISCATLFMPFCFFSYAKYKFAHDTAQIVISFFKQCNRESTGCATI